MTVIGFVILVKNITSISHLWQTLAICFVTTLYGLILAALSAIAGLRVSKKLIARGCRGKKCRWNL